ncbi:MAG: class I SAM-dependent methyltransferase [Dehalococcoidia bacterium]|nr:class I SAM-dependent methyltransferase [Dehalococcoidia bacterium]
MIDDTAAAVLRRLERRDALERESGAARAERLRQVTPDVGRFLHTLVLAAKPGSVVEVGTSGGYSTIWLATAARAVGASLVTLEMDPAKVRTARESLREAGVGETVTLLQEDAFVYLGRREEAIDFAFLDAEKEDYLAFYELLVPLLAGGGVLVADNLTSHAEELAGFRERALSDPRVSAVVVPIGRGELLAVRDSRRGGAGGAAGTIVS